MLSIFSVFYGVCYLLVDGDNYIRIGRFLDRYVGREVYGIWSRVIERVGI